MCAAAAAAAKVSALLLRKWETISENRLTFLRFNFTHTDFSVSRCICFLVLVFCPLPALIYMGLGRLICTEEMSFGCVSRVSMSMNCELLKFVFVLYLILLLFNFDLIYIICCWLLSTLFSSSDRKCTNNTGSVSTSVEEGHFQHSEHWSAKLAAAFY